MCRAEKRANKRFHLTVSPRCARLVAGEARAVGPSIAL